MNRHSSLAGWLAVLFVSAALIVGLALRPSTTPGNGSTDPAGDSGQVHVATAPPRAAALNPAVLPDPLPSCESHSGTLDYMPVSVETQASLASAVVRGIVSDVGEAQWNTPNGKPPDGPEPVPFPVIRLFQVKVTATLSGKASTDVFWVPGGSIGCSSWTIDAFPADLKVGQEVVIFASQTSPATGQTGTLLAAHLLPVVDGWITTVADGRISVDSLAARLAASAK